MLQLVRAAIGLLCGLPLPLKFIAVLIFPAIPNFISPMNQIVLWLCIFTPIYTSQSWLSKDAKGERTFRAAFRNSYFIYHAVFIVIYAIALFVVCKASDAAGEMGL